jgi:hypothetical protein
MFRAKDSTIPLIASRPCAPRRESVWQLILAHLRKLTLARLRKLTGPGSRLEMRCVRAEA